VLELVCQRCGLPWHSAASASFANERGGCLDCGGILLEQAELASDRLRLVPLRGTEEATPGRDDDWAA
jgi:hypothetical protein